MIWEMGRKGYSPQLGEVKVNPLSVPASIGNNSTSMPESQSSSVHKVMLSLPTNQSGLGMILEAKESCKGKYKFCSYFC